MKHLLFVYGTLKNGYSNHHYLGDNAIYYGKASVPNLRLYEGPGFPYAFPTDDGSVAKGELYEIDDDALRRCDQLEGYPHHYNRIRVVTYDTVPTYDRGEYLWTNEAWVYVSPQQPRGDKCKNNEWSRVHVK